MNPHYNPLPPKIIDSFRSAIQPRPNKDESVFYGPYNRLLHHVFGVEGSFEIHPQYHPQTISDSTDPNAIDLTVTFNTKFRKHPVLILEAKEPKNLHYQSKRLEADEQMRRRLGPILHDIIVTPRFHGISAYGTHMAFYEYSAETRTVIPSIGSKYDKVPLGRWRFDILEEDGVSRLYKVREDIVEMCQALKD